VSLGAETPRTELIGRARTNPDPDEPGKERLDRVSDHDESKIKVTDKRMFAPDGSLREEYRFLEEEAARPKEPAPAERAPENPPEDASPGSAPGAADRSAVSPDGPDRSAVPGQAGRPADAEAGPEAPPEAAPELPGDGRNPSFYDLVVALAEPASVYMRNAVQSPAEASQSLEVARLYIDLLDVLRQKTAGNLTGQEADMLEDALHQLRLGYVQTKG